MIPPMTTTTSYINVITQVITNNQFPNSNPTFNKHVIANDEAQSDDDIEMKLQSQLHHDPIANETINASPCVHCTDY